MNKIRIQIKPHIFCFIFYDGILCNFNSKSAVFMILGGITNRKLKVDFIETKGIRLRRRPGGFHWNQGYSTDKEARWISLKPRVFDWEGAFKFSIFVSWTQPDAEWRVVLMFFAFHEYRQSYKNFCQHLRKYQANSNQEYQVT